MTVLCNSPIDPSQIGPALPADSVLKIVGDYTVAGAEISSEQVSDAEIGAALTSLGWTTTDGGVSYTAEASTVNTLTNRAALQQKAVNALSNNQTFLGIATPTSAQAIAQVQALTRQVDALIRLAANALESISGT